MDIGIIGSGCMGGGMGAIWAGKGHRVCFSHSRDPARLASIAAAAGHGAWSGTIEEAAEFGQVVVLAVPWALALDLLARAEPYLAGKTLITCVVPWNESQTGLILGTDTSAAEEIAAHAPAAHVVEALAIQADVLGWAGTAEADRPAMFYCGDHPTAKAAAADLIEDLDVEAVDAGSIRTARYLEPATALLHHLAVGQGQGTEIAFRLIRHDG
jgi:predicted dinucleotide-binding enzyme